MIKKTCILLSIAIVLSLTITWKFKTEITRPLPLTSPITVDLPRGAGAAVLAEKLSAAGLTQYPLFVRIAARIYGYDRQLKAGEYLIEPRMNLLDVFQKIADGKVIMHKLTIPEGWTTAQIIMLINTAPFLTGDITELADEGDILPETYAFSKGTSRNEAIIAAKRAMRKVVNEVFDGRAESLPMKTPEELIILASIIEKETGISSERDLVASVFVNRLNAGMPLQTDPTVIYALTNGQENLGRSLTRKDLEIDSPYNTYKYKGLPIKPICNPGIRALEAAAHPAQTPYFYFVANGEGGHNFATTLSEHNRNVQNWKNMLR